MMSMGKKAIIAAITISLVILSLLGGTKIIKSQNTSNGDSATLDLQINSPSNNAIYTSSILTLNFTQAVLVNPSSSLNVTVFYSIDEGSNTTLAVVPVDNLHLITGKAELPSLSNGPHNLTLYEQYSALVGSHMTNSSKKQAVFFTINSTTQSPTPTLEPPLSASLFESASALNFGNTINFTVSVEGGNTPYTYTWNIEQSSDVMLVETTASAYYSSNSFGPGSHHIYVEVKDADNNIAKTLTVEFNVLPLSSLTPSAFPTGTVSLAPTESPTQQPTPTQTAEPFPTTLVVIIVIVVVAATILLVVFIIVGLLRYLVKSRKAKS
jgi:hypothetical protein